MKIVVQFTSRYNDELKEIVIGDHNFFPIPTKGNRVFVKADNVEHQVKITGGTEHSYEDDKITIFGKHQLPA